MKKLITTILASALSINTLVIAPINISAAGSTFEFENGTVYDTGDNITTVVTLSGASGGKAVELKDSGDSVTVSVNAEKDGMQTLSIRYSQPYDENGKYQNVIVNGENIGQIFCAYTGEGQFRTVSISAGLRSGDNTVTVEGSWGWTYLDCITIGETSVSVGANPIISRNAPAYSGKSDSASSGNDDKYYTFWTSAPNDYLAYDLSAVPISQRKKVLAVWYNTSTYDNIGIYVNKDAEPVDYTIEVNKAAGGSYPAAGWEAAETVTGNGYSSRQHLIDMDGYNWIRMKVTKANGSKVSLNFDIHDASNGVSDSWIFFGDSITAGSMVNAYGTGYAAFVNQLDSSFFPVQENGGIGGISSRDGKENIDKWLSTSPAKYVSIAYGTNDAWGNPNNAQSYYENTKYMIDAVLNAGKVPVLPKIPYATNSDVGSNTGYYNAMIDKLYNEYGDKLVHGPDFDEFFRNNTWGLSDDGVHPNSDGYEAMRKLWAETMYENVYKKMSVDTDDAFVKGDVSGDGEFNVADIVILQKWLLAVPNTELANWKAGDLCEDGRLDVFDMVQMRKLLTQQIETPHEDFLAVYEAENAVISGNIAVSDDSSASGGKAVGSFSDDGDDLAFTIEVPAAGSYCFTLTSKGMGGDKYNEVLVDGENIGGFESKGNVYSETSLRRVMLTAGKHTVSIKKSWGWIMVDSLKVTTDDVISNSVYNVENKLINSNADECAKELFSYLCDSYGNTLLQGRSAMTVLTVMSSERYTKLQANILLSWDLT